MLTAEEATLKAKALAEEIRPEVTFQPTAGKLWWIIEARVGWDLVEFFVDPETGDIMRFGTRR